MERIISNQNNKVKAWAKLATSKGRKEQQTYLLDGWHLIKEAIQFNAKFHALMATSEQLEELMNQVPHGVPVFEISQEVANHISDAKNAQGIFAEVTLPSKEITPKNVHDGKWLLLDHINDPGNLGTLIRTADAAGFNGIVLDGSADPYSPKVVRSMQGSQFHLEIFQGDLIEWSTALKNNGFSVYGSKIDDGAIDYRTVRREEKTALILGNEANGVREELAKLASGNLYIPIVGNAESLNVGVAGGILMFALI